MRKAIIILSIVTLFAVAAGVFASKRRYTGFPVITTTTAVRLYGTLYTRPGGATFCYPSETLFFTTGPNGVHTPDLLTRTAPPTLVYTVRKVGGPQTLYIPDFCSVITLTTTRVTNVD